ncbi:MAG: protein kinase [Ktedonobacteraceae bacterium]|nr:protein kinase [Ktedonobacteraceae bacterium]
MAETGRIISRRYLLQRLLKQGQACAVYQGFDQVLQRTVAVKVAPAEHIATYRAALRATSQFSHPNIIGIYDLVVEPDNLYLVQEYVDGDDFAMLLQAQPTPYEVVDIGVHLCQALLYAGASSRKICHGDLTPASVMRDRRKIVRVNNFALPADLYYFTAWSTLGGDNIAVSDSELPWGQLSEARHSDDTRAVGILLYQLLAGRQPNATAVEPPTDGRLRFSRNVPAELCEVVARSIVRQHPQYIGSAESLLTELKVLAEILEPPAVISVVGAAGSAYQAENMPSPVQFSPSLPVPGTGNLVTALPVREAGQASLGLGSFRSDANVQPFPMEQQISPSASGADPTVADIPVKLITPRQGAYSQSLKENQPRRLNVPFMILLGLLLFALFFVAGFYLAHSFLLH